MRSVVLVLALLLVSSLVHAQPAMTPPVARPQAASEKSPTVAIMLSIGIPVAGAVAMGVVPNDGIKTLGFFTMYFGPSTGQWYAGKAGGLGLGLRALSVAMAVGGFLLVVDEECDIDTSCKTSTNDIFAGTLAIGGAGLWIGSSVYDVVLAKRAAERWNTDHGLTLTPSLVGTSRAPGLFVSGRF